MDQTIIHDVWICNSPSISNSGAVNFMKNWLESEPRPVMAISNELIGLRLRTARIALRPDLNQSQFATWLGIQPTSWNNFEKGVRRIPIEEAAKLAQKTGLNLDWIYRGVDAYLPLAVRQAIETAAEDVVKTEKAGKKRA